MATVVMFCTAVCPYCRSADRLLDEKGVRDIERIRVDLDPARREEMRRRSGRHTVPQIWVGERHVGGCDDLYALDSAGELDALLTNREAGRAA